MSGGPAAPDFGRTAGDYGRYRQGFPPELFERLRAFGIGVPGQHVVDVATGTGTLARGFAAAGCLVTGIDPAEPLLAEARRLAPDVEFRVGTAEATGLPSVSADVVAVGQAWHWFDRPAAARELRRVLRPGGWLVICHLDWLPWRGTVVHATEELILAHNPSWRFAGGTGMYPRWAVDVAEAGFTGIETFSFDLDLPYSHEAWRGRVRASAGVAASLDPSAVERFDAELAGLLAERFPAEALPVPHRCWALVCRA